MNGPIYFIKLAGLPLICQIQRADYLDIYLLALKTEKAVVGTSDRKVPPNAKVFCQAVGRPDGTFRKFNALESVDPRFLCCGDIRSTGYFKTQRLLKI